MKQASRSKEESFGERLAKLVTDDLSRPRPRNFMTKPKSKPKAATRSTHPKDRQAQIPRAIGTRIVQVSNAA
jgi:hypothetical protein